MQALRSAAVLLAITTLLAGCSTLPSPTSPPATANDHPQVVVNSLGMRLVAIPAGRFWMGSAEPARELAKAYPLLEAERFAALSDEAPVHEVHISRPFYLGQHEVTVGQFRRFLAESGYQPESVSDGTGGYGYNAQYDPATTARGDAFEGRSGITTWLYQITTHYCLNLIRDRGRRRQLLEQNVIPEVQAGAEERRTPTSDLVLLQQLLAAADEQQAQAAVYVFLDGLSHEEAAELMAVSKRTVGNLIERFLAWASQRTAERSMNGGN